jgi:hypothetical protein
VEVNSQLHILATSYLQKEPTVSIDKEVGLATELVWTLCQELELWSSSPVMQIISLQLKYFLE